MGGGPEFEAIKEYASHKKVPAEFLGLMPYDKMCEILGASDIGVNPIVKGSVASLINKVADYAACGLPVVNTQDCEEYCQLLDHYHAGINLLPDDVAAVSQAIGSFYQNPASLKAYHDGSLLMASEKLSRQKSNESIIKMIKGLFL